MFRHAIVLMLLAVHSASAQQEPRWAEFAGIRVGGPVDDVLALNARCYPVAGALQEPSRPNPGAFVEFAFGHNLPHHHNWRVDSVSMYRALATATLCHVRLLHDTASATVLAVDRRVAAVTIWFVEGDSGLMELESVRALVLARWPRATEPHPRLSSWTGGRYRAHLVAMPRKWTERGLVPELKDITGRLIMLDALACTAFDRRVHADGRGTAEPC